MRGVSELVDLLLDDVTGEHCSMAFYDREGQRISMRRKGELSEDARYRVLRVTPVPGGDVISAWLGYDQLEHEDGGPYIYGTILYRSDGSFDIGLEEFAAREDEALAYHERLVVALVSERAAPRMGLLDVREERDDAAVRAGEGVALAK